MASARLANTASLLLPLALILFSIHTMPTAAFSLAGSTHTYTRAQTQKCEYTHGLPHLRGGGRRGVWDVLGAAKIRIGAVLGSFGLRMTKDPSEELKDWTEREKGLATSRGEMFNVIQKTSSGIQKKQLQRKVAIIGSGNFASAVAPIIGRNCERINYFHPTVKMWVYEEEVERRKLSEIINTDHENVKYLPGIKLPSNIVAVPDIIEAATDANVLVFCMPHQFLGKLCETIRTVCSPDCIAVSLVKGVEFDESGIVLISSIISKQLGGMDVSVLMGANLAWEVAKGSFCETTVGYRKTSSGKIIKDLFDDPLFRVGMVQDVPGPEACGALKNVVALGAGFVDGMELGDNTKGAIIRIGLMEMKKFVQSHFPGVRDDTFFESCGVADLIVTCYGGRNRRCAEAFVKAGGSKTFEDLELELLNGQKLQGTLTLKEIYKILQKEGILDEYPLFSSIHRIAFQRAPPDTMIAAVACHNSNADVCEIPDEMVKTTPEILNMLQ